MAKGSGVGDQNPLTRLSTYSRQVKVNGVTGGEPKILGTDLAAVRWA